MAERKMQENRVEFVIELTEDELEAVAGGAGSATATIAAGAASGLVGAAGGGAGGGGGRRRIGTRHHRGRGVLGSVRGGRGRQREPLHHPVYGPSGRGGPCAGGRLCGHAHVDLYVCELRPTTL